MNKDENMRFTKLLKVSAPIMLSFLSMLGMMFVDRLFLARYSLEALSATVSAGNIAFSLTFGLQTLTLIASVFVAQLNGKKDYANLAKPVWQMVWFSLASFVLCIPILFAPTNLLFGVDSFAEKQVLVFRCLLILTPLFGLLGALQSFYNGQEKTKVITYLSVAGNLVNVIFDPILIFGIKGLVPSLGIIGANIATGMGLLLQVVILFYLFLSPKNRQVYGSGDWRLDWVLFKKCVKVGFPEAFAVGAELFCWGLFYHLMTKLTFVHMIVTSIAHTLIVLFFFFGLGLEQGASILAGNLIGANQKHEIKKVLRSGAILIFWYTAALMLTFKVFANSITSWFFSDHLMQQNGTGNLSAELLASAMEVTSHSLIWIGLYIGLEALRWLFNGVLRAAGDTLFLLCSGVLNIIVFMIVPTYVLMMLWLKPVEVCFDIWLFFAVCAALVSFVRFKLGKWQQIPIL